MHELGLALEVVDVVSRRAEGARVRRVVLEIGALAAVLPDALRGAFEIAAVGSSAEGADLEIRPLAAHGRCRACSHVVATHDVLAVCPCGGIDLEWLDGTDLRIREMEVT
jgi:hydrogenase nickel incorporation protein HypA/HybF